MALLGPFTSAFHHAENYDNQILVATGIGITPILSAVLAYNKSRRVNIVWIVREEDMLTFFLDYLNINKGGWMLVFYTGKTPLHPVLLEYWAESNVKIIMGRPSLGDLIPNIIRGVEGGNMPFASVDPMQLGSVVHRLSSNITSKNAVSEKDMIKQAYDEAKSHGYQLTGILNSVEMNVSQNNSFTKLLHDSGISDNAENVQENIECEDPSQDEEAVNQTFLKSEITDPLAKEEKKQNLIEHLKKYNSVMIHRKSSLKKNSTYEPWNIDCNSSDFVTNLDLEIRETWGVFFCGGNKRVLKDLDDASKKYGIDLHTESFFW